MKAHMSEFDAWFSSDSSEPEPVRRILDALCDSSPSTQGDGDESERRFFEELGAALSERREWSVASLLRVAPTVSLAWGAPPALEVGDRRSNDDSATVRSPQLHERIAAAAAAPPPLPPLPPPEPIVPFRPVDPTAARPEVRRAPEFLATTAPAPDIPPELREQMGRLPFKPRAPGPEFAQTTKVPVHNLLQGLTAAINDDSIEKAVAAVPFAEKTGSAALVRIPRLTLNQYASLRAELSVSPERSDAIRNRYYVMNEAARRALDEHWRAELAASPEMRATFEKALAEYTAWLRAQKQAPIASP